MCRLRAILVLVSPLMVLTGGCPLSDSGGSNANVPSDVFVQASAPSSAAKGEAVALSASLSADVGGVDYRWLQTFGRVVSLLNGNTADASFVTPSLKDPATVGFRVDALRNGSMLSSAEVHVQLRADPNFGLSEEPAGDGKTQEPFPKVKLTTSKGVIIVELNHDKAPLTVNNFLRYVDDGFYDGTIFHRVITDFVVQGGGFNPGLVQKHARSPIRNESDNGLTNDKGTIAMARTNEVDSATSQFYFNLKDNTDLNRREGSAGYCVFGKIVQGQSVVDDIAAVMTHSQNGQDDVPVTDVTLDKAERFTGTVNPEGDNGSGGSDSGGSGGRPGGGSNPLG